MRLAHNGLSVPASLEVEQLLFCWESTDLRVGADWLQGPYIYSLYREQYGLPERLVALLFVLGFLTAGAAAPLVGVWADQL